MDLFPDRRTIIAVGGLKVYWYGFLYVLGFLSALYLLPRLQKYRQIVLSSDQWVIGLTWIAAGVLIGGRLGYVLLYDPMYFFNHPEEIIAIWSGGMASHGGFIGVALALLYISRRFKIPFLALTDIAVIPAALGLAFGRIGNFINQELSGTIINASGERHPWALYAAAKDVCVAAVSYVTLRKITTRGYPTAVFLISYSFIRFWLEFLREPVHVIFVIKKVPVTEEQLLTLLVFVLGVGLLCVLSQQQKVPPPSAC